MSWLTSFLNCVHPCNLQCCNSSEISKINDQKFWLNIQNGFKSTHGLKLLHEKNIYLNESSGCVLILGIDPQAEFKIAARLEIRAYHNVITMNGSSLNHFLENLNQYFDANTVYPQTQPTSMFEIAVQLSPLYQRMFQLRIDRKSIKIDEESLQALYNIKSHIQMYILMLEYERKPCEAQFFKLLNHYCYKKSIQDLSETQNSHHTQTFFDEIINLHCDCLDKSFALEIASNFSDWFQFCTGTFLETLMLNESNRLETFSTNWPHNQKFINIKTLAKSGLYFLGRSDIVECAFCHLRLKEWRESDDPIIQHYILSPNCIFLNSHKMTHNIPDINGYHDLDKLLSVLKHNTDIDEPDCA